MLILPAIDLIEGKAVRLLRGDYEQKTVYHDDPVTAALDFRDKGAEAIHLVDLEGAKSGNTPNFDAVVRIKEKSGLLCEIGGGIRDIETVERYLGAGIDRVILGTAAIENLPFLCKAVSLYGDRISVGADFKNGYVATHGWTKTSALSEGEFCEAMQKIGVSNLIVTDISRDGAMQGTNLELYRRISRNYSFMLTASGGVSSLEDVCLLRSLSIYGAIIGKAYYTGAIDLKKAIEVAK